MGGNGSAVFADDPPAGPGVPAAAEVVDPAVALDASVRQHAKAKALDAVKADVVEIGKRYAALDAAQRKLLGATLAWVARNVQEGAVRKAVLDVVGASADKSLSGVVRPFLVQPDKKAVPPLLAPAIEAAARLADDDLVVPLMALVKDSKVPDVAASALKAFAGYGGSKRLRNLILRDLVATVSKDQPGVGKRWEGGGDSGPYETGRTRTGDDQASRYQMLSAALVPTLNQMTGQNCGSAEDWFALYDKYKSTPGRLFAE